MGLSSVVNCPLPNPTSILTNNSYFSPLSSVAEIESRFPEETLFLRRMGVHPNSEPTRFVDPYNAREIVDDFRNIGEHSFAVAICASVLANGLKEAGVFSASDLEYVFRRALVHDIIKPYEIFLNRAWQSGRISNLGYLAESVWDPLRGILSDKGFTDKEVQLVIDDFGSETGGRPKCLKRFLLADRGGLQGIVKGELPSKIIHLADDMICSSLPKGGSNCKHWVLTPHERVSAALLDRKAPMGWDTGLGVDIQGELVHLENIEKLSADLTVLGSYHGLMIWISNQICQEILNILNLSGSSPEQAVKEFVKANLKCNSN